MKNIHLIAIGGAIMHNLAIALHRKGYRVSGSDDAIYDPARANLEREGLLPETGWNADRIHSGIDQIILGMHARPDNPELLRAQELGIPIASFPEFVAAEAKDKRILVVAGSHGKTSTTSMIMHVLGAAGLDFDYLVGSSIDGFELSVRLSEAPLMVIEGDEYLSSPIDRRSKFHWYPAEVSIITGIAYDHINVFPTFESYLQTFKDYIDAHRKDGEIIWYSGDPELSKLMSRYPGNQHAYDTPEHRIADGQTSLILDQIEYPVQVIGAHNLQNIAAAAAACLHFGVSRKRFFELIADFTGAGKRMERIYEKDGQVVFRDFAHSPSKLKATTQAVKETYPDRPLFAAFELHTFSSLNASFLPEYKDAMQAADRAIVYVDPHVFAHRKMKDIPDDFIRSCFGEVQVMRDPTLLKEQVDSAFRQGQNILLMSSGTFSKTEFHF